jgi:hypothetical protein
VHVPYEDTNDDIKDSFYEELGRVFDQFPRYDPKILLGDFNAKVGREDIFKPTIGIDIELNSKNKAIRDLYRGITEFKKGYQPKTNLVKDERGNFLADPQKILTRWKNYFCQLLNVQGPGGVRQTEIHTAEPFVPKPSAAEIEVGVRKLERYKAPGSDQIPAELIQAGGGDIAF